jgi:hypothetical protein
MRWRAEDPAWRDLVVEPGLTVTVPVRFCLGEVRVLFEAASGTFFDPELEGLGSFAGLDHVGTDRTYEVRLSRAKGTPASEATAAPEGGVNLCVPMGDYELSPFVTTVDPGGGTSRTELEPFQVSVGCGQVLEVRPELQIALDPLPACAGDRRVTVTGRVTGGSSVDRVFYVLNAGPEVDVCVACGVDPSFQFEADLQDGRNTLQVSAEAGGSATASVSTVTELSEEPSAVDLHPGRTPLRVAREWDGALTFTWEDLPSADYNLYRGTLTPWRGPGTYDHAPVGACGMPDPDATLPPQPGSAYFLVTSSCGLGESSLGRDSSGLERPPASPTCP